MTDVRKRPAALVTGASSGIGAAVAQAAADQGYDLVLVDVDEHGLHVVADRCRESGAEVVPVAGDVTDLDAMCAAAGNADRYLQSLSAVLHCAGIDVHGTLHDSDPASWRRCLEVNVIGTFNVARATIGHLLTTGGSFTAVASDAGVTGAEGFAPYAASKHAVVGFIRCMALDYGPRGVRSNAIAPGIVDTPMSDRLFADDPDAREHHEATVPLGRFARPAEVAAAMLHLASPAASYTNGHVYVIDGGSTAGYFDGSAREKP